MVEGLSDYVITSYAEFEMQRRGISRDAIHRVVTAPEQRADARPGRVILQSRLEDDAGKVYLLRVVVDVDRHPAEVVTAYRTSRVSKYWRDG
jgi:uncharacterized protein DUF4258